MNFYNGLVFVTSLAPVWALLIDRIGLKGKRWFWFTEFTMIIVALGFLMGFQHWRWQQWAGVVWFLYAMEIAIMLFLFTKRFGQSNFSRNLALSLLVVYVLSEVHEWPRFILCDYLHFFQDPYTIMAGKVPTYQRILNNIYIIISFVLTYKFARLKASKGLVTVFCLSLMIPILFINIEALSFIHVFKRALMFTFWACIFYFGSGKA